MTGPRKSSKKKSGKKNQSKSRSTKSVLRRSITKKNNSNSNNKNSNNKNSNNKNSNNSNSNNKNSNNKNSNNKNSNNKNSNNKNSNNKNNNHNHNHNNHNHNNHNDNNKNIKNSIIRLNNLNKQIKKNGKINTKSIKYIEFGLKDLKNAFESACKNLGGELVNDRCRINVQNTVRNMITVVKISRPTNTNSKKAQHNFLKKWHNGVVKMSGGGPVGCQNTHCPHNTRLVYGAEGTIHCDAPKWRGGQEMHYLLGAKY